MTTNTSFVPFGRALYYPHINITNVNWLKFAALYYDGIDRIVPSADLVDELDLVKMLNDNSAIDGQAFLRNIDPQGYADQIAHDFIDYAKLKLNTEKKRAKIYSAVSSAHSSNEVYRIHLLKMGNDLIRELPELGIPVEKRSEGYEDWYEFDTVSGAIYMSRLANCIASSKSLPIVSDEPIFQEIVHAAQSEKQPTDLGYTLASMAIESIVPQNIESVSAKTIVEFRNKYKDERAEFYAHINKLVENLQTIDDKQSLMDALHSKKAEIERATKNIKGVFQGLKIRTTMALIGLSVPSFATLLGAGATGIGLAAVALGTIAMFKNQERQVERNQPYSYILTLKNELDKKAFAKSLIKGNLIF